MNRTKRSVNLGLFTNIIFSILKTVIGIYGKSQALIADGINSTSDVAYYLAVSIFMKKSQKPADEEHPYGHRQLDNIAAIVVGAFIVTTGATIFWNAMSTLFTIWKGEYESCQSFLFPMIIASITVVAKIYLYLDTKITYKQTRNPTIKALMNDHVNDLMASGTVLISLIFAYFNENMIWIDPVASCLVAIFIFKTGFEIVVDSSNDLMDAMPDDDFAKKVEELVLKHSQVHRITHIGVHKYGPSFVLNMTIEVDSQLTVAQGDVICDELEEKLLQEFPDSLKKTNIHYHPKTRG
ncbi:cation transporter [bacterium]|nr:cation transporter [bacterium]